MWRRMEEEQRLNIPMLEPGEEIVGYGWLAKDGTFSDAPMPGSVRVALIVPPKGSKSPIAVRLLPHRNVTRSPSKANNR